MHAVKMSLLLVGLMTTPAWAIIDPGPGGGGGNDKSDPVLRVTSHVEGAVQVSVNGGTPFVLELDDSQDVVIFSPKNRAEATIEASLVSTSFSATETCIVQADKVTVVNIDWTGSALSLTCDKPGKLAALARESGIAVASLGGLLGLLLLGVRLGGRQREAIPADEACEA